MFKLILFAIWVKLFSHTICRCNSPLQFLFEIIVQDTEDILTTEQLLSNALGNLNNETLQLELSGQNITIQMSNIRPSVNTRE